MIICSFAGLRELGQKEWRGGDTACAGNDEPSAVFCRICSGLDHSCNPCSFLWLYHTVIYYYYTDTVLRIRILLLFWNLSSWRVLRHMKILGITIFHLRICTSHTFLLLYWKPVCVYSRFKVLLRLHKLCKWTVNCDITKSCPYIHGLSLDTKWSQRNFPS